MCTLGATQYRVRRRVTVNGIAVLPRPCDRLTPLPDVTQAPVAYAAFTCALLDGVRPHRSGGFRFVRRQGPVYDKCPYTECSALRAALATEEMVSFNDIVNR
eukprot:6194758-Pleurochrysis_carterae.AAC.1